MPTPQPLKRILLWEDVVHQIVIPSIDQRSEGHGVDATLRALDLLAHSVENPQRVHPRNEKLKRVRGGSVYWKNLPAGAADAPQ